MFISKHDLFNDVLSTSDYTATKDGVVDGKRIETGVKRNIVAEFGVIYPHNPHGD
jgi:hypothetical protein